MKATIIYLPPGSYSCINDVPAINSHNTNNSNNKKSNNANEITTDCSGGDNNNNNKSGITSVGIGSVSCREEGNASSCCHRLYKNSKCEKCASLVTLLQKQQPQEQQQELQQQTKKETTSSPSPYPSSSSSSSSTQTQTPTRTPTPTPTTPMPIIQRLSPHDTHECISRRTGPRCGRERRRNSQTHCVSTPPLSQQQQQQLHHQSCWHTNEEHQKQQHDGAVQEPERDRANPSGVTMDSTILATSINPIDDETETVNASARKKHVQHVQSQKSSTTTTTTSTSTSSSLSSSRQHNDLHRIDEYDNLETTQTTTRIRAKMHSRLADSFTFSRRPSHSPSSSCKSPATDLVKPIDENSSRLGECADANGDGDAGAYANVIVRTSHRTAKTLSLGMMTETTNHKYVSQTTTLKCRCFKENSDIKVDCNNKECRRSCNVGSSNSSSSSSSVGSSNNNDSNDNNNNNNTRVTSIAEVAERHHHQRRHHQHHHDHHHQQHHQQHRCDRRHYHRHHHHHHQHRHQHHCQCLRHRHNDRAETATRWTWLMNLWRQPLILWCSSHLTKPIPLSKMLLFLMFILTLITSGNCWTGRQDALSNCTFPARWEGSWFLSGYQQSIHIKGNQFSYRGKCAASDGNKYLIVDEKGCHRCLVIYEKHKNVLQYKESECEGDSMYLHQSNPSAMAMRSVLKPNEHTRGGAHPNLNGHSRLSSSDQYIMRSNDDMNDYFCKGRETLQNLCDQIPGDALLYSLFRESAEPVKCPLKGPFIFTYNRGHGECKSPVSNIESCTEESRLLLSFQACPDVQGTESTVEELTCLATWKDGNSRYLVGLVSHHHAISNEERYRCFVYEKISSLMGGPPLVTTKDAEYKLAQSGDATCNGLDSAEVGSRIMSLRKPPVAERCDFPVWFKGPRHWHGLMGNAFYNYHTNDGSVHIIKPNGYMETRALCEQINKQTSTEMMAVVHYTTGCQSGFMCMMFYRRDTHIIEIQTGKQAARLEDACAPDHFDINKMPYITLLATNPESQMCPMEGLYNLRGAIGPPYITTRHKRNHNNKIHSTHGGNQRHRQLEQSTSGMTNGFTHKKHTTLSFRNSERIERDSWHSITRGRSRRATAQILLNANTKNETNTAIDNVDGDLDDRLRNRRNVPGCITNYKAQRQLWVGCTEPNLIDVRPLCTDEGDEEYSCHGSWSENGTVFIIARHKGTKHGVCISYRPTEGNSAKLVIGDACYRGAAKPPEHHLVANLSVFGKCGETGSASSQLDVFSLLATIFMASFAVLLGRSRFERAVTAFPRNRR